MTQDEQYMLRCIELAKLGNGYVAPNPMVGAILVYQNKIIGEGYHAKFGEAHAEVNCLNSVSKVNQQYISSATLYVSLEPCSHYGKTPPCTNLILERKIKKIVIGCRDNDEKVNGAGIEILKQNNIGVVVGVLEDECKLLNKHFYYFNTFKKPYVVLKWAQTANKTIGNNSPQRLLISNEITNILTHKWRGEVQSILVGTNTALIDNPYLSVRNYTGKSPIIILLDRRLKISKHNNIFKAESIIVLNSIKEGMDANIEYVMLNENGFSTHKILEKLYSKNIQSILVEGGGKVLQSFIDDENFNEVIVIENETMQADGINAPAIKNCKLEEQQQLYSDTIYYYSKK